MKTPLPPRSLKDRLGRPAIAGAVLAVLLGPPGLSQAASSTARPAPSAPPPSPAPKEEPYAVLQQRNIFDPERSRSRPSTSSAPTQPTPEAAKPESLALTGTLLHDDKAFAFFGGSESAYRKVVPRSQKIAGFTVSEITSSAVVLQGETERVDLRVGHQLRREPGGAWKAGGAVEVPSGPSPSYSSSSSSSSRPDDRRYDSRRSDSGRSDRSYDSNRSSSGPSPAPSASPSSGPPPNASEILRKLMERREKEMSR